MGAPIRAKKYLGQHFLLDRNLTAKIAGVAGDLSRQNVIEIGPGSGSLTQSILDCGVQNLVIIEKDKDHVDLLEKWIHNNALTNLTLYHADALDIDPHRLVDVSPKPYIIANLPYNIATTLIARWLPFADRYAGFVLTLQKEVALRIVATAGKSYGRLSVITAHMGQAHRIFDIDRRAFTPAPAVTSSVIHFKPYPTPCSIPLAIVAMVARIAFGQRRKTLRRSLSSAPGGVERLCLEANIDPGLRPEALTINDFRRLALAWQQTTK